MMTALLISAVVENASGGLNPADLRCELLVNPIGIDAKKPRLSWQLRSSDPSARGVSQSAYRILVASDPAILRRGRGDLWDSGKVQSAETNLIEYAGKPLVSRSECFWKVQAWDQAGMASRWSKPAMWTMGLLDRADWHAEWLSFEASHRPNPVHANREHRVKEWVQNNPAPLFRRDFQARKAVKSAIATICGLGYYEMRLNGKKVGDHELDPPFTRYDKRCLYVTYDVTRQIKKGANAIGVMLGNGWLDVIDNEEWNFLNAHWREAPRFILNLHVVYADGTSEDIVSGKSWKADVGPIVHNAVRNGEEYDARREQSGWDAPGFDDKNWKPVEIVDGPKGLLSAMQMPPVRVTRSLDAVKVTEPKPGVRVYDFGQNTAGRCLLRVRANSGTPITIRYGERLAQDGTVDQNKVAVFVYAGPFQQETYIAKGTGTETWESRFTYHGFRYAEVVGLPGKLDPKALQARVLHTDFAEPGTFECSNALLNKVVDLTRWAYRSNYLGYPTDCPHREKNGWTGDAHLVIEMAQFMFENTAAYEKWMNDFADEQPPAGDFPGIVPNPGWGYGCGPAWDSAYVVIPWNLYLYRGDNRVLADHYEGMKRLVDYLAGRAKEFIVDYGLSDWVTAKTETPNTITSTAYFYWDSLTVARVAELLGETADAAGFEALASSIRQAFQKAFLASDSKIGDASQCAQACALYFGLVDQADAPKVLARLAENVEAQSGHLDFGFLGDKWVFRALSDGGRHDLAYKMATKTDFPSYGHMIAEGATTLWEDWVGDESQNHVAFGDIVAWYYSYLAGIEVDPGHPGFAHFTVRPRPVGDLSWVRAKTLSPHGPIEVEWILAGGNFTLKVVVPPNSTATVWVPARDASLITEGGKAASSAAGVRFVESREGAAVFKVGSGTYEFRGPAR